MYPKMNPSQSHGTFVVSGPQQPVPRQRCVLPPSGHTPPHSCNTDVYEK